ncbi:hypothetical protein FACS1894111_12110 [Clostridia bacterium]|nr:hypothetical protein FACS1894111_12110 [Clostridia bacterium]
MEYPPNNNPFMQNMQNRTAKMPFYMTYPMQNVFLEEAEYEKDIDRLKSLYPADVRVIQEHVEEECDKMEYEGSLMFDEYPDRLMLKQVCDRISKKMTKSMEEKTLGTPYSVESEELRLVGRGGRHERPYPGGPGFYPPPPAYGYPYPWDGGSNLIEVLLYNEMYQRRCRHRRCRRWW